MARTRYCVVLHKRKWTIVLNGGNYGPYASRGAAIEAAVEAARENGYDSEVLVQDEDGITTAVWSYGDEPLALTA